MIGTSIVKELILVTETYLEPCETSTTEGFPQNSGRLLAVNYLH